jgi:dienelactone hydrolase
MMIRTTFKTLSRALLLLLGVLLAVGWYLSVRDYEEYFRERRGDLTSVDLQSAGGDSLSEKWWVTIHGSHGLTVRCGMLTPRERGRKYPAIVLLGGKTTGKYAVDYALDIKDVLIIAVDYGYTPRESYTLWNLVRDVPEIREALLDVVPSAMLALDYLSRRGDVDTTKLVVLGYSFGAPLVPAIVAHDRRPAVAAVVYGGGDLHSLIRHNVRRYEGPVMSELVGAMGGILLHPIEPLRYAEKIAPVPLVMINGTEDEQIPRENAEKLFAAASEPKSLVWIDSRHVHPRNVELTHRIIRTLAGELRRLGVLP